MHSFAADFTGALRNEDMIDVSKISWNQMGLALRWRCTSNQETQLAYDTQLKKEAG